MMSGTSIYPRIEPIRVTRNDNWYRYMSEDCNQFWYWYHKISTIIIIPIDLVYLLIILIFFTNTEYRYQQMYRYRFKTNLPSSPSYQSLCQKTWGSLTVNRIGLLYLIILVLLQMTADFCSYHCCCLLGSLLGLSAHWIFYWSFESVKKFLI